MSARWISSSVDGAVTSASTARHSSTSAAARVVGALGRRPPRSRALPARRCATGQPRLEERLGAPRIGQAGSRSVQSTASTADAAVGDDHRAAEPERPAQPVEVEAQDEVRHQPRIAEAQPEGQDQDRPGDRAGHHLQQAGEPSVAIADRRRSSSSASPAPGRPSCGSGPRRRRSVDRGQPAPVRRQPAAHGVEVDAGELLGDRPDRPLPMLRRSISITGLIWAPVPQRKTSSATYSSVRSIERSTTSMPRSSARSRSAAAGDPLEDVVGHRRRDERPVLAR